MNKYTTYGIALTWVMVGAAYYVRVPGIHEAVSSKWHWATTRMSPSKSAKVVAEDLQPQTAQDLKATPVEDPPPTAPEPARLAHITEAPAPPPAPEPVRTAGEIIAELASDRASWPASVRLKSTVSFPAVINGKVVGRVNLGKDSMVSLVAMSQGKLGLEHKGGGAWVNPGQTDLLERLPLAKTLLSTVARASQ